MSFIDDYKQNTWCFWRMILAILCVFVFAFVGTVFPSWFNQSLLGFNQFLFVATIFCFFAAAKYYLKWTGRL